ncbi:MAG: DUF1543 domain-containing protein [Clostridia bacterium]|nr:DUF1543 domain-containing protein [Clostridia bacterium]
MNLYMIGLGGKVHGANIEVHDVQFVVSDYIDQTVERLKANWYGMAEKLHMDSYTELEGADGFKVKVTKEKFSDKRRLFFVHLGGYKCSRNKI